LEIHIFLFYVFIEISIYPAVEIAL